MDTLLVSWLALDFGEVITKGAVPPLVTALEGFNRPFV